MHLRHDKLFNTLTFLSAFVFLGVFIVLTYDDLGRRGEIDNAYGGTVDLQTGIAAPGGLPATTATIRRRRRRAAEGRRGACGREEGIVAGGPCRRGARDARCSRRSPQVWRLAAANESTCPSMSVPELGYPSCTDAGPDDPGVVVAQGHLRSGPVSNDQNMVERFELRRTACGYTFRNRQEWPADITDVEVRYDANLTPLWAWKRMTLAASPRPDGDPDVRRYELRTGDVFIKRRDAQGAITLEQLLPGGRMTVPVGARVGAVIAPGRGSHHGVVEAREAEGRRQDR